MNAAVACPETSSLGARMGFFLRDRARFLPSSLPNKEFSGHQSTRDEAPNQLLIFTTEER